jgi:hypothetical protein
MAGPMLGADCVEEPDARGTRQVEAILRQEAPIGIEPMMEVLQTSALPLGYGARTRTGA